MSIVGSVETPRAWAEVDLDALASNLAVVRRQIGSRVAMLLVAKADAYGHGATAVCRHALAHGIDGIGVTTCAEALELQRAGVHARMVVLGPVWGDEARGGLRAGVEFVVPSFEICRGIEDAARVAGVPARVHAKIDTGMMRLGVEPREALELLSRIQRSPWLELAGVMTHLAGVEGEAPAEAAAPPLRRFDSVLARARAQGLLVGRNVWIHAANSATALAEPAARYDAVRLGIAAYGVSPGPGVDMRDFSPVLSVRTRIVHLRSARPGDTVGYGGTWKARRPSRIAVLSIGYDDGISWRLGNRGSVLLRGERAPVIGRVSMDYTTVDVTHIEGLSLGHTATILGADGRARIRVEDLARLAGTIPYEITCSLGKRVARTYRKPRASHPASAVQGAT